MFLKLRSKTFAGELTFLDRYLLNVAVKAKAPVQNEYQDSEIWRSQ